MSLFFFKICKYGSLDFQSGTNSELEYEILNPDVSQRDSHVNVWWLESSLVNVVEGESLRRIGAVLVHLHRRAAAALAVGLSLGLLPPGCHDL